MSSAPKIYKSKLVRASVFLRYDNSDWVSAIAYANIEPGSMYYTEWEVVGILSFIAASRITASQRGYLDRREPIAAGLLAQQQRMLLDELQANPAYLDHLKGRSTKENNEWGERDPDSTQMVCYAPHLIRAVLARDHGQTFSNGDWAILRKGFNLPPSTRSVPPAIAFAMFWEGGGCLRDYPKLSLKDWLALTNFEKQTPKAIKARSVLDEAQIEYKDSYVGGGTDRHRANSRHNRAIRTQVVN
jgi:hypothetical protein